MILGLLFFAGLVVLVAFLARLATLERKLVRLQNDVDALKAAPSAVATAAAKPAQPNVAASPAAAPTAMAEPPAPDAPAPEAAATFEAAQTTPGPATSSAASAPSREPSAPRTSAFDFEQLVGGVWLQNVGAVLLMVGFFFLILWGYATGRFGPEVLVTAGVLAGLGLVWRGAALRASALGVGHALIGVGAGVVWLAIYVGHFKLNVLPPPIAFVFVVAASAFTGALGVRYGVQLIAVLGVLGAHLPSLMTAFVPLYGFAFTDAGLLLYLTVLNAVVFALAVRLGWSALALASLLLTASTWVLSGPGTSWSWPIELGLGALFAALGLAPLRKLAGSEGPVRPVDLAVIAVAPLALLAASSPMFQVARPVPVSTLLLALAALYTAAAWWVDQRRPERDLWRPLTAAAILFFAFATERAVGPDRTSMAWILEGCALVLLGLRPRGEWLRWCGHVVVLLGATRLLAEMFAGFNGDAAPLLNANAITSGIAIAALLYVMYRLLREEDRLGGIERLIAQVGLAGAHSLLMVWSAREAWQFADAMEGDGGLWRGERDVRASGTRVREQTLFANVMVFAWVAQAAWLVWNGVRAQRVLSRFLGYGIAMLVTMLLTLGPLIWDSWARDRLPVLHPDGLISFASIGIVILTAVLLARSRNAVSTIERRGAEVWAAAAAFMLLTWISREADHVARTMLGLPGEETQAWRSAGSEARQQLRAVAGTLTSVGWLLQAVGAFVVGWMRRSAFMRWMGMGLVGVTVLKFLIVDLSHADPFWRFLTSILAGAAMLTLSYVYQRRGRRG